MSVTGQQTLASRIRGCLLGGACGDALGAPVEFIDIDAIKVRFGPDGITDFVPAYGVLGAITDDTQMTLFTVEGLIRANTGRNDQDIASIILSVHGSYLRWLTTQDRTFCKREALDPELLTGWLIGHEELWHQRAPGATCLSALRGTKKLGQPARNNSKGCGAVMRSAPYGFLARSHDDVPFIFKLAVDCGRLTHNHPSGYLAAGAFALIIAEIVLGSTLDVAVSQAITIMATHDGSDEVVSALNQAVSLAKQPNWRDCLPELGEGWVAEETLAIAVLCALAAPSPEEAIIASVNLTGDSDSTGAVTGNIVGALHGRTALPARWVDAVEMRSTISTLADEFYGAVA